jgi:hypothetical protein
MIEGFWPKLKQKNLKVLKTEVMQNIYLAGMIDLAHHILKIRYAIVN